MGASLFGAAAFIISDLQKGTDSKIASDKHDFQGKLFMKILTLFWASPPPLWHPHCDDDVLPAAKLGSSHCAPSPNGGLVVQEGGHYYQEKFSPEQLFFKGIVTFEQPKLFSNNEGKIV
jgi:hypothetical protein